MKVAPSGPKKSGSGKPAIVIIIVAVVVIGAAAAVWFFFFASSPEATVEAYMQASIEGDVKKMNSLLSSGSQKVPAAMEQALRQAGENQTEPDYSVGSAAINGNRAIVPMTTKMPEQAQQMGFSAGEMTLRFGLIKETGAWKIDTQRTQALMMEDMSDMLQNIDWSKIFESAPGAP